jgi:hypothetical protein
LSQTDEDVPEVSEKSVLEIHEEFLQRVEEGGAKIRVLSIVTIVVAALLAVSYISQIVLPYVGGGVSVTVSLTNPTLVAIEVLLTILALIWLYVGVTDYRFVSSLAKSIKTARMREKELERTLLGGEPG